MMFESLDKTIYILWLVLLYTYRTLQRDDPDVVYDEHVSEPDTTDYDASDDPSHGQITMLPLSFDLEVPENFDACDIPNWINTLTEEIFDPKDTPDARDA
ncbi:hypothetical protein GE09DRAFT_1232385 [Coniochaeta sp. 2T2.1]|nr:hypothetical protein GE09DRAFT_1232385 [Coniochaeta sp. 2T2.1]